MRPPQLPPFDANKAWTKTFQARIVLVARRLIDASLATHHCLHRLKRYTVGLHRAITTAFADGRVDMQPQGGVFHQPAFASATLLRSTGLHKDDTAGASALARLTLHRIELIPVQQSCAWRQLPRLVQLRLIADQPDGPDPLSMQLLRDNSRGQRPVHHLPAGHRNRVVIEHLVGDVDAGCDRRSHGQ